MLDRYVVELLDRGMAIAHENHVPRQFIIRGVAMIYVGAITWNSFNSSWSLLGAILGSLFVGVFCWLDEAEYKLNVKTANARRVITRSLSTQVMVRILMIVLTANDFMQMYLTQTATRSIVASPAFLLFMYLFSALWPEDPPGKKFHKVAFE